MSSLPLTPRLSLQRSSSIPTSHSEPSSPTGPLDATRDARQIVRLSQCAQCSYTFQEPVTLPCGNSICKKCIPDLHLRSNISYPATPSRLQGFTCPFSSCKKEHAIGDCSVDVALNKIMSMVKDEIDSFRSTPEASSVVFQLEEWDKWTTAGVPSLREKVPYTRTLSGGRLAATFAMAAMGELQRESEVHYTGVSEESAFSDLLDSAILERVKDVTRSEMDCQVCYGLFLDPYTTPCGHTFCRKCIHRVLDHSNLCPVCRRSMALPPNITAQQGPSNITITKLLQGLCPDAVAAREEAVKGDESIGGEMDTPLFICTLAFPSVPTFLHIFEPRYRLMIRRAVENGSRTFGMLLHNPSRSVQGNHGAIPFYEYGTLLQIINMHLLPDGRSLIETRGVSRFRVLTHGSLDGYMVGKVERVDDMPLHSEEALEAAETTTARTVSAQDPLNAPQQHRPTESRPPLTPTDIDFLPTQDLMDICTVFVRTMKEKSAPWLNRRVFQIYGECPEDPAVFPWWFASVLPIADEPKYQLLQTSSVRQRLKMCANWISQLEAQRWSFDNLRWRDECAMIRNMFSRQDMKSKSNDDGASDEDKDEDEFDEETRSKPLLLASEF